MKLAKAIKTMQERVDGVFPDGFPENEDDMRLGIEALQVIKWLEDCQILKGVKLLPGETK